MGNPNAFLGPQDWAQMTHIGTESTGEGLQASTNTSRPIRLGCCEDC